MEELSRIKAGLVKESKPVYDFGTGDPRIPTWSPVREALVKSLPEISQYPSVKGIEKLAVAHAGYLKRRFNLATGNDLAVIPSQGSKEAIFNIALCLVGRAGGKKHMIYPDPGYPVYRSSTLYAGGIPWPVRVSESSGWLLEPWELPDHVQQNAAAIWINHPHNPTGATAPLDYWKRVIDWCHKTDTILLSDDCYVDIYDTALDGQLAGKFPGGAFPPVETDPRPLNPLQLTTDRVLSFMSLSKRSGLTGYRAGMVAGDPRIIKPFLNARANFGVGSPDFIQHAAAVAWADDEHVVERRRIFSRRLATFGPLLKELGMIKAIPSTTFYLWAKIPPRFGDDDVKFVLDLARIGVIASPSQWLSEGIRGYVRFALVPEDAPMQQAMNLLREYLK
ncbi:aminotransferase class I/II-fold pyridoxal phosphate-dependent enzyme [bacterium]|nr:aminotransferase class I/II-fold pyridoxal phosphate-dependent enzyme [bacterium]